MRLLEYISCPKNKNFTGCFKKIECWGVQLLEILCIHYAVGDRTLPLQPPRLAGLQSHETWLGTTGLGKKVIQDFQTSTHIAQLPLKWFGVVN